MQTVSQIYVRLSDDSTVEQVELPATYGNISGYHFQEDEVHKSHGFLKAEIVTPVFDPETHAAVDAPFVYDETDGIFRKTRGLQALTLPEEPVVVPPTIEERWMPYLSERFHRLQVCDWVENPSFSATQTQEYLDGWSAYRQALRDLTDNFETPEEVIWPVAPHSPVLGKNFPHGVLNSTEL